MEHRAITHHGSGKGPLVFIKLTLVLAGTAALLLCSHPADAARFTLLQLKDFGQSVTAGYQYSGTSSSGSNTVSSSAQSFNEAYGLSSDFSLLSSRLIRGSASLSLNLNQESQDSGTKRSSSSLFLGYNVSSLIFGSQPCALSVSSSRQTTTLNPSFSRSYDLRSDSLNVHLSLKNNLIPARIDWARFSSETSGLDTDRRQTVTTASASATRTIGISSTSLSISQSAAQSDLLSGGSNSVSTTNLVANAVNSFHWQNERGLTRAINNNFTYNETSGLSPQKNQNFVSALQWKLGKALDTTGAFNYGTNHSALQDQQQQSGNVSLSHHLFESLTTSISATESSTSYNDGSESGYGGGAGLSYRKKLPSESTFGATYDFGYSVSERNRQSVNVPVENERHAIPPLDPRQIPLANPTFLKDTITVRGAQTLILYSLGLDYIVIPEGIEVLPGRMPGDTELLISYSFFQDPNVAYATFSHGVGTRLTLYGGRHSLYANYRTSSQEVIRGKATDITLTPSSFLNLGVDSHVGRHRAGAEFGWSRNFAGDLQYLNSRWSYQGSFASGETQLAADDRFSLHDDNSSRGGYSWDNHFNFRTTYTRNLAAAITGKFGLAYLNSFGKERPISNSFSLNMNIEGHFRRMSVILTSGLSWGISSGASSRSESVSIAFSRYF